MRFQFNEALPKLIALRVRRSTRKQSNPTDACQGSSNISSAQSESSWRQASDVAQTSLPLLQAAAGTIPLAGPPMQAAISGLLTILQNIDRKHQNREDIANLKLRLYRLHRHLCNASTAKDPHEQFRRDSLTRILLETSNKLENLKKPCRRYASRVTQAITGCSSEINDYLFEYLVSSQMQLQNNVYELSVHMPAEIQSLQRSVRQLEMKIPRTIALGCVTLVDATGYEHQISVDYCGSFQQLNMMVAVLFQRDSKEARIQRSYLEKGLYDLCIDKSTHVTQLTSHEWSTSQVEAGMKIVMRVIILERRMSWFVQHRCRFCRTMNVVEHEDIGRSFGPRTRRSIDCQGCKRRFQISTTHEMYNVDEPPIDSDSNQATGAEMNLIRNFHVQQIGRLSLVDRFMEAMVPAGL